MKKGNIIASIIVIITSLFFYFNTMNFKKLDNQIIGASFMPRFYTTLLVILSIILIIKNLSGSENKVENSKKYFRYSIITMLFILTYLIIIPVVGFYSSTILLVFTLLYFAKLKNKVLLVSIPIGTSIFIFLFFQLALNVIMPTGLIF
ncbi:tripartite tricarboxylate transporter TctB family protein [Halanaerobium salsuginis]|jgi:uncharacterized membrane protein|uniref:Tripartite tricarboxylate transporter TctB family protein n=1 Tax=Halanaerobium salsuginis TaxID=29563 RepID=A0A1I4GLC9_9FIRM|nr:tripartite tricarboxylate transporter TctB family protein [Halanaerobium salsuginis]SFL30283.1 Tripartite tricarboxylate transporter TctB family protein [Halanaerobium salsuginis]